MRKVVTHYALGLSLGLLVCLLGYLFMLVAGLGFGIFILYVLILFGQGAFYGLTAVHGRSWSTISFVVNFILWVTELVQLDQLLEGSSAHMLLYHNDSYYWLRFALGGLLWATNKLVLDFIIDRVTDKRKSHVSTLGS